MRVSETKRIPKKKAFLDGELKTMSEGKDIKDQSKKHWKHKAYCNDFGGGK